MTSRDSPRLSVVVPVHNEQENVRVLHTELRAVLEGIGDPFEIIFVNDGSEDATLDRLEALLPTGVNLRIIDLDGNFGEAAALSAGFHAARGKIVITLDGDGQNDPADIPRLLAALRERNLSVVSGYREQRQEAYWLRVLPSRIANALIARVTGVPLRDCGCGLKVYRRNVLGQIQLPRGMNRFLPAILGVRPDDVAELPTRDRERRHGASHYGIRRTLVVLRDLIALPFIIRNARQAEIAAALFTAATAALAALVYGTNRPLAWGLDVVAAFVGLIWWNSRRFNRAQASGVYRVRREYP